MKPLATNRRRREINLVLLAQHRVDEVVVVAEHKLQSVSLHSPGVATNTYFHSSTTAISRKSYQSNDDHRNRNSTANVCVATSHFTYVRKVDNPDVLQRFQYGFVMILNI